MAVILIIDTDPVAVRRMTETFESEGHHVLHSTSPGMALHYADGEPIDVAFLKDHLPEGSTIDIIQPLLRAPSSPEVIILSDDPDPAQAEAAIRQGAWDYCETPASDKALLLALLRVIRYRERSTSASAEPAVERRKFENIRGSSLKLLRCLELADKAAQSDVSVLIEGETGTGKELFAWAIHNNSARADRNYVVVDCAALPETLVESTLFGHEKGAFTGATSSKSGLIKQADGGTLFLDEVGELPLTVQKSFLRVLQEGRYRPVGARREEHSDFRVIAATNRNLTRLLDKGKFRTDLLFRLQAMKIVLPPLREHSEDIEEIVHHHVSNLHRNAGVPLKEFSADFFETLQRYLWPGNVRELLNAIDRSIMAARDEPVLFPKHLPTDIRVNLTLDSIEEDEESFPDPVAEENAPALIPLQELREATINELEKNYLADLMLLTKGDMKQASAISGLSRSRLYALLKRHDVNIPR
jgi:two-component system NtrC family response regulator